MTASAPIPCAFVMVTHEYHVLWGLRVGEKASGIWGWPGGKADRAGTMAENAVAELREETGLEVPAHALERIQFADEWIDPETGQSYPNQFFRLRASKDECSRVKRMEPDKHEDWRWFSIYRPPYPAFEAEIAAMKYVFGL